MREYDAVMKTLTAVNWQCKAASKNYYRSLKENQSFMISEFIVEKHKISVIGIE